MSLFNRIFGSSNLDESHPAFQVGQIIAASLIEGNDPEYVSPSEAQLLVAASVSTDTYVKERFLLRACANEVVAQTRLLKQSDCKLVCGGIHHWLAFQAKRSDQFRVVYDTYKRRLPRYLAAAQKESARGVADPSEFHISEVWFTFAEALTDASSGDETFRNGCASIAMVFAPVYWDTQFEVSIALYRQAGLQVRD